MVCIPQLSFCSLIQQGRIHGNPVADGLAGAVIQKPLGIQKCDGPTDGLTYQLTRQGVVAGPRLKRHASSCQWSCCTLSEWSCLILYRRLSIVQACMTDHERFVWKSYLVLLILSQFDLFQHQDLKPPPFPPLSIPSAWIIYLVSLLSCFFLLCLPRSFLSLLSLSPLFLTLSPSLLHLSCITFSLLCLTLSYL